MGTRSFTKKKKTYPTKQKVQNHTNYEGSLTCTPGIFKRYIDALFVKVFFTCITKNKNTLSMCIQNKARDLSIREAQT